MKLTVSQGGGPATGSATGQASAFSSGAAIVAALQNDPAALRSLMDTLTAGMLSGDFAAKLIAAVESVVAGGQQTTPGRRIAGTVSALSGAIQGGPGSGQPMTAMVFLNGAATAVPCYVPSHLEPDLATGQEVWVEPVNGALDDLMVVAIRAFTATPVASAAMPQAGGTFTGAINLSGGVSGVGGQTTAGGLGVPALVAHADNVVVGDNATHTILTVTPGVSGWYRIGAQYRVGNPGAAPKVAFQVSLHTTGGAHTWPLFGLGTNGGYVVLNGANSSPDQWVLCQVTPFYADSGTAIALAYTNPGAAPSDNVYAVLERLT